MEVVVDEDAGAAQGASGPLPDKRTSTWIWRADRITPNSARGEMLYWASAGCRSR